MFEDPGFLAIFTVLVGVLGGLFGGWLTQPTWLKQGHIAAGFGVAVILACLLAWRVGTLPAEDSGTDAATEAREDAPTPLPSAAVEQTSTGPSTMPSADGGEHQGASREGSMRADEVVSVPSPPTSTPSESPRPQRYLNKMLRTPDKSTYYITSDGIRQAASEIIVECLKVRRGIGDPVDVSMPELESYPLSSRMAFCLYSKGMNFVTEEGSNGYAYVVDQDGFKRHAGGFCVEHPDGPDTPPQYRLYTVPKGELDGHREGSEWFPSESLCLALPRPEK